jgi:type I restriction enzyme S subunit
VVPSGVGSLTYPDKLIRIIPDESLVNPKYLAMACSAGPARDAIRSAVKTTAGQAGISGREIKNIPLLLPDLDEQNRRVAKFQERADNINRTQEAIESALHDGEHLRGSILAQAFAGQLVPQNPNDEDASSLLERIRSERPARQTRARGANRRTLGTGRTDAKAPQQETLL